jgi:hypothetical protein
LAEMTSRNGRWTKQTPSRQITVIPSRPFDADPPLHSFMHIRTTNGFPPIVQHYYASDK